MVRGHPFFDVGYGVMRDVRGSRRYPVVNIGSEIPADDAEGFRVCDEEEFVERPGVAPCTDTSA